MPSVGEALTAPYIGRAQTVRLCLGLTLERALACTLDRLLDARSLKCGLFWERCLTGKKIPNVVGFGTFPNVVGFPSSRTVSRIEAALPGGLFCAFCGGGLDCALLRKAQTAPWVASWTPCLGTRLGSPLGCALACSLGCFALGRAWGESSLGPFL